MLNKGVTAHILALFLIVVVEIIFLLLSMMLAIGFLSTLFTSLRNFHYFSNLLNSFIFLNHECVLNFILSIEMIMGLLPFNLLIKLIIPSDLQIFN